MFEDRINQKSFKWFLIFYYKFIIKNFLRFRNKIKKRIVKTKNDLIERRNDKTQITKDNKKSRVAFSFPWWFKIVAYLLSFLFSGISIFFIIVKGISFGNDACTKWLTSVIISLFSSIFLTQPLQVIHAYH